jgi:hypothetical protein
MDRLSRCVLVCAIVIPSIFSPNLLAQNPVPFLDPPLVPTSVAPGGPAFTLTINGAGFVTGATVSLNGAPLATTFVRAAQLTAAVPAANIAYEGTASITVTNPGPGGGTSNVQYLAVANPVASPIFTAIPVYGTGYAACGIAVADFNEDGLMDIAYCNGVELGIGDGSFQAPVGLSGVGSGMTLGDFNGDGHVDVAVTSQSDFTAAVFLGKGDGTFQPPLDTPTVSSPGTVVAGDFNGDGKLDLAISYPRYSPNDIPDGAVAIMYGNGDGTFQTPIFYDAGSWAVPGTLVAGDFNGDGILDLVYVAELSSGSLQLTYLQGNGANGPFNAPVRFPVDSGVTSLVAGDVNGDGKLDVVTSDQVLSSGTGSGGVYVILGNGDGTFQPPVEYASAIPSLSVAAGDLNQDAKVDLALGGSLNEFAYLLGNGDGTFQSPFNAGAYPIPGTTASFFGVAIGDFNHDGSRDVISLAGGTGGNADGIVLFLQGEYPVADVPPTPLTYENQLIGTTSAPKTVTLTNTGLAPLAINFITATGDFGQTNTCGNSVAAGANCNINVTFTPTAYNVRNGELVISDNAPGTYQVVDMNGFGLAAAVTLSPNSLSFSNQAVGTTSAAQTVTVTNSGSQPLTISSIVPSGDFAETDTCVSSPNIPATGSCTISVTFTPTAAGMRSGMLTINDNTGSTSPQILPLNGTGLAAAVSLSATSVTFTNQYVGTTGLPQSVTLTNTGNEPLAISGVQVTTSGGVATSYAETDQCTTSVAAGVGCTIAIFFDPAASGNVSGTLTITDNAPGSPQTVTISGTGQDFSVGMSSGGSASATVSPGQTATFALALTSGGGFNQSVALTCTGAPAGASCNVSPGTVTLNPTTPVPVTITVPTAAPSMLAPGKRRWPPVSGPFGGLLFLATAFLLAGIAVLRRGRGTRSTLAPRTALALPALGMLMASLLSCGGGGGGGMMQNPGTPAGTYNLNVAATFTSGTTTLTHNVSLTVKVN